MKTGATVVAAELSALASVMRKAPFSGEPSTMTYGLATSCSITMPSATMNMLPRNMEYITDVSMPSIEEMPR